MRIDRRLALLALCVTLSGACVPALAQMVDLDPDWKEVDVPAPPAFSTEGLLGITMPLHLSLQYGVDPKTFAVSNDGVVRYVVIASSTSGAMNALYEGIRCATGEFKTYARYNASSKWRPVSNPSWRPLDDNGTSKHTRALAIQGVCEGRTPTGHSTKDIVDKLRGVTREPIN